MIEVKINSSNILTNFSQAATVRGPKKALPRAADSYKLDKKRPNVMAPEGQ
jgi:hypothetical protein